MKATHLEQIARDYESAEENLKLMKEAIDRKERVSISLYQLFQGMSEWTKGCSGCG